tara:strand:+ start:215 stop:484 length:270 start_codon:yes stop_codon:yes gene_type:complete
LHSDQFLFKLRKRIKKLWYETKFNNYSPHSFPLTLILPNSMLLTLGAFFYFSSAELNPTSAKTAKVNEAVINDLKKYMIRKAQKSFPQI